MQDRRELERFDLKLPARINVLAPSEKTLDLITQNVCAGGAFFPTRNPLSEGQEVLLELVLRRESGQGSLSMVTVGGKVLRSQPDGMAIGFNKQYKIAPAV
jgi:hypothetical protein